MKRNRISAAVAALLLPLLLIACGGADKAADVATATPPPPAATATKPPPVVAIITAAPGSGSGAATGNQNAGNAPATPTAVPTIAPTEAPPTAVPTDTPVPTAVPPTAAPVVVQPTAVPPTAAPAPPTAVPAPTGINGLTGEHFAIQSRADLTVNGDVWFEFRVANSTGGNVPFDALGVMPKKDGVDRPQWYQHSWGGNNDVIPAGGLSWDDHINLPEAGNYTLRLVICFDGAACQQQKGTWHTLSPEIPVTIR